ncbi:OrU3, partial [Eciton burchellii]
FVWAVELNRFGLRLTGLWRETDEATMDSLVSDLRMATVFIITFLSIIPLLCALVRIWGDISLMIDNLQITLPLLIVSVKLVIMRWKRTAVSLLVKTIEEDWLRMKKEVERDIMIRRARTARSILICGYALMLFAFVVIIIFPSFGLHFRRLTNLTDRNRLLPLQAYYFYNTDKSPYFELTLVVQALTISLSAITYTSVDAFLGVAIFHLTGQLENFRFQLLNLISHDDFCNALRTNVETHLRLIRFVNNVEDSFSLMMLVLILFFGSVFSLFGFLLVTLISSNEISNISVVRIGFILFGIVTLLMHTFFYCGAGEIIADQCEAIYRTICDLEWYKLESKKRRNLILLMMRANEPFRITAGRLFPLTMTMFCSLLKTSAGYISFLLAMS